MPVLLTQYRTARRRAARSRAADRDVRRGMMTRRKKSIVVICSLFIGALLLVSLWNARERARRVNDAGNVHALMYTLLMYAEDHEKALPEDLGVLIEDNYCSTGRVYVSVASPTVPPQTAEELRSGRCDYIYFGRGLNLDECSDQTVILMTRPGIRKAGYVSLGFADGRVEGHIGVPEHLQSRLSGDRPSHDGSFEQEDGRGR